MDIHSGAGEDFFGAGLLSSLDGPEMNFVSAGVMAIMVRSNSGNLPDRDAPPRDATWVSDIVRDCRQAFHLASSLLKWSPFW